MSFAAPFDGLALESFSPQSNPLLQSDPACFLTSDSLAPSQQHDYAFDFSGLFPVDDIGHIDDVFQEETLSNRCNNMAKPHACSFPGCMYRAYSKRDLDRHNTARHLGSPKDKFFCPEAGCKRARKGWPGTRKDLRDRHVRTVHPQTVQIDVSPERVHDKDEVQALSSDDIGIEDALPRQDVIGELRRKNARLESQLDEMQKRYEKMRSMVMIAVAAAE